jgi:hypothetical protein
MLIQLRHDTGTNWANNNPLLASGEPGWDATNLVLKFGDGVNRWNTLPVASQAAGIFGSFADVASLGAGVSEGVQHFQSRLAPGNLVQLQGNVALAAATYAPGQTLATMPAGQIPAQTLTWYTATRGSNTPTWISIASGTGIISTLAQIVVGATDILFFDGVEYVHA